MVADEVRNLAMRAAEAAKNTASLIESTVSKIKEGAELVTTTSADFVQVHDSTNRVIELIGEIAAASNEQAQGIGEINKAVTEMDKVTQQNAAFAEELAASMTLFEIGGQYAGGEGRVRAKMTTKAALSPQRLEVLPGNVNRTKSAKPLKREIGQARIVSPKELIPMEGEGFRDF